MIEESLQEQAALYASGAFSAREREQFESTLEFHRGLPELVAELEEISAALLVATLPARPPVPSAGLEARLLRRLRGCGQRAATPVPAMTKSASLSGEVLVARKGKGRE